MQQIEPNFSSIKRFGGLWDNEIPHTAGVFSTKFISPTLVQTTPNSVKMPCIIVKKDYNKDAKI